MKKIEEQKLPEIHIRKGRECYLDPIRERLIYITPEETVRQRVIAWLITELQVPKQMITVEEHLSHYGNKSRRRADIVIHEYDQDNNERFPIAIVECKAPGILLGSKVAEQVLDYTDTVCCDYAMITDKVIDPLFLDDLKTELNEIKGITVERTRKTKLTAFQNKLSGLKFLDPACGSGNFLTETYISLRRLENAAIRELTNGQMVLGEVLNPIKMSISQFYGIEINDFAVTVGKTALWIAESQMMKETEDIVHMQLDFLPLKTNAFIVEGNALQVDWESVIPKYELNYIMGNPPFVGAKYQSKNQHQDMEDLNTGIKDIGLLDYVGGWYIKAARYMNGTQIKSAFVSTNSITQGGEPAILWKYIINEYNTHIIFAYRTFVWNSEAKSKAQVHCVIIGFSDYEFSSQEKRLYMNDNQYKNVKNISPYLVDAPTILVEKRTSPLCDVPKMMAGNKGVKCLPLMLSQEEKDELISKEPMVEQYIKKMIGSAEFINNIPRYCLWLVNCPPNELRAMPEVMKRVQAVKEERLSSTDKQAKVLADTPTLFRDTNNPKSAIIVPLVSSERRRYIPMGYIDDSTIANNKVSMIPDGTLYEFGVLTSNVHYAWMRTVSMSMKSDYSYSI